VTAVPHAAGPFETEIVLYVHDASIREVRLAVVGTGVVGANRHDRTGP